MPQVYTGLVNAAMGAQDRIRQDFEAGRARRTAQDIGGLLSAGNDDKAAAYALQEGELDAGMQIRDRIDARAAAQSAQEAERQEMYREMQDLAAPALLRASEVEDDAERTQLIAVTTMGLASRFPQFAQDIEQRGAELASLSNDQLAQYAVGLGAQPREISYQSELMLGEDNNRYIGRFNPAAGTIESTGVRAPEPGSGVNINTGTQTRYETVNYGDPSYPYNENLGPAQRNVLTNEYELIARPRSGSSGGTSGGSSARPRLTSGRNPETGNIERVIIDDAGNATFTGVATEAEIPGYEYMDLDEIREAQLDEGKVWQRGSDGRPVEVGDRATEVGAIPNPDAYLAQSDVMMRQAYRLNRLIETIEANPESVGSIQAVLASFGGATDSSIADLMTTGSIPENVAQELIALRGFVTSDQINQARERAVATGNRGTGYGQITQRELDLLASLDGSLSSNQSPELLLENLRGVASGLRREDETRQLFVGVNNPDLYRQMYGQEFASRSNPIPIYRPDQREALSQGDWFRYNGQTYQIEG
jgi:hypothetical protein